MLFIWILSLDISYKKLQKNFYFVMGGYIQPISNLYAWTLSEILKNRATMDTSQYLMWYNSFRTFSFWFLKWGFIVPLFFREFLPLVEVRDNQRDMIYHFWSTPNPSRGSLDSLEWVFFENHYFFSKFLWSCKAAWLIFNQNAIFEKTVDAR